MQIKATVRNHDAPPSRLPQLNKQNNIKASVSVAKEKLELYTMAGSARPYNHLEGGLEISWKVNRVPTKNDLAILLIGLYFI